MSDQNQQNELGSVRVFFGYTLLTIGWLIAGTSGLCTTVGAFVFGGMALIIGAGPIVVGIVMIVVGRSLLGLPKASGGTTPQSGAPATPPHNDDDNR
jgi:hypothetical protein